MSARKCLVISFLSIATTIALHAQTPAYQSNIDMTAQWFQQNAVRQTGSILDGAPSNIIDPYFASLGAMGLPKTPTYAPTIENWIRWYLAHLNRPTANGAPPDVWNLGYTIYNYNVDSQSNEVSTNMADSTDSYAAMFLSLVWQYYSGGGARAQSFVHGLSASDLNGIAQVMIKTQQPNGLTIAKTDYTIEYLMDNSEVYRGLRDAASLFHFVFNDDAHAQAYNDAADKVRQGILGVLWDAPNGTFAISNDVSPGVPDVLEHSTLTRNNWYPDAPAQFWPVITGVIDASDPRAISAIQHFDAVWNDWYNLPWQSIPAGPAGDQTVLDTFPWVAVAYGQRVMNDPNVNTYINNIQNIYVSHNFIGDKNHTWGVSEAGAFMYLNNAMLQSLPATKFGGTPETAVTVDNLEQITWQPCTTFGCAIGNTANAPSSDGMVSDSGVPNGTAHEFRIFPNTAGNGGYSGMLWFIKFPQHDYLNWVMDYYVKISNPSIQDRGTVEFDANMTSPTLGPYVFGTECNFGANTTQKPVWRFWTKNPGETWDTSNIPCAMTNPADWYHVQMHFVVLPNNQYRLDEIRVTDVTAGSIVTNLAPRHQYSGTLPNTNHGDGLDTQLVGCTTCQTGTVVPKTFTSRYNRVTIVRW